SRGTAAAAAPGTPRRRADATGRPPAAPPGCAAARPGRRERVRLPSLGDVELLDAVVLTDGVDQSLFALARLLGREVAAEELGPPGDGVRAEPVPVAVVEVEGVLPRRSDHLVGGRERGRAEGVLRDRVLEDGHGGGHLREVLRLLLGEHDPQELEPAGAVRRLAGDEERLAGRAV